MSSLLDKNKLKEDSILGFICRHLPHQELKEFVVNKTLSFFLIDFKIYGGMFEFPNPILILTSRT